MARKPIFSHLIHIQHPAEAASHSNAHHQLYFAELCSTTQLSRHIGLQRPAGCLENRPSPLVMDITDISPQLEQLDRDLEKLREALKPLLGDMGDVSSKLPLLDKAKLYVLASYAIESLLFCEIFIPSPPVSSLNNILTRDTSFVAYQWG